MLRASPKLCILIASGYPVDMSTVEQSAGRGRLFCTSLSGRRSWPRRSGGSLPRKKKSFELAKEVKAIARERVGPVPAGGPIRAEVLTQEAEA